MQTGFDTEIIISIIAGIFGLLTVWLGQRLATKHKLRVQNLQHELNIQSHVLSMARIMGYWEKIKADVDEIINTTEVDRFLLLVSWNGKNAPLWVSATYQHRGPGQTNISYIHTEIDKHYQDMLTDIERHNYRSYITEDLPNCLLREIYDHEGVTAGSVHFLGSYMHTGGSREVDFCSYATHEPNKISSTTELQCRLLSDRIRALTKNYEISVNALRHLDD